MAVALALALLVPLVASLLVFARAYGRRCDTEVAVNAQLARLAAWNARADAWERWSTATGGSIPQSFLDELDRISR